MISDTFSCPHVAQRLFFTSRDQIRARVVIAQNTGPARTNHISKEFANLCFSAARFGSEFEAKRGHEKVTENTRAPQKLKRSDEKKTEEENSVSPFEKSSNQLRLNATKIQLSL